MPTINDIKKTIDEGLTIAKETVSYAAERAEDISRVAALRVKIFALRRQIERLYRDIGEAVFRHAETKGDVWKDAAVQKTVKEIRMLETKVNELFAKLDSLSARAARGTAKARAQARASEEAQPKRRRKPASSG